MIEKKLKFVDLFAGIGGFHLAMHEAGCECVFASEIDKYARMTYEANFKKFSPNLFESGNFNDNILDVDPQKMPDFDILCAGFPCQPFSQAGYKKGFSDSYHDRGNMFFTIRDIIKEKRPRAIFLENVRHLVNHDSGRTFSTIENIIKNDLNYTFYHKIIKASDFGLPQHRPRIYMIGFRNEDKYVSKFSFPKPYPLNMDMNQVWKGNCERKVGYTLRVGGRSSGLNDKRNWDTYLVDGEVRKLGPEEGRRMMGFPDDFEFPVSKSQAMKQLGNSVAVNAVRAVAMQLVQYLNTEGETQISYSATEGKFVAGKESKCQNS